MAFFADASRLLDAVCVVFLSRLASIVALGQDLPRSKPRYSEKIFKAKFCLDSSRSSSDVAVISDTLKTAEGKKMKLNFNSDSFARAYSKHCRLLPNIRLKPAIRPDAFRVKVLGSRGVWYDVLLYGQNKSDVGAACSCAAGQKDMVCYHVASAWSLFVKFSASGFVPEIRQA